MSILPPPLLPGDMIGVMAPSSFVDVGEIEAATAAIEAAGHKVFVHPQTYERLNQSAGNELQKALAFQGLWQRDDIKAIWCARGGNRAMHFVDAINFDKLKDKPKALIGFSDVTVLLNAVYAHTGMVSYHGPVFKQMADHKDAQGALDMLAGKVSTIDLSRGESLSDGVADGHLIGGNLSLFQYLPETLPDEFWKDGILFLEDCGDEYSRLDRMVLHLRRLGVLAQVKGLIFGEFSDLQDSGTPYGFSWRDIVEEHVRDLDIPILFNAPFGHGKNLPTFPVGQRVVLDTKQKILSLNA